MAWLDFNGNGSFDVGEVCQAIAPVPSSPSAVLRNLFWPVAPTPIPNGGHTYLRIRLTKATWGMNSTKATGYYEDGETEDYRVLVDDFPLTVNLIDFHAKAINNEKVQLDWRTSAEENFIGFEVQRSSDNNTWTTLATVYATGNGSGEENLYSYEDLSPLPAKSYYRLRLVNNGSGSRYSEIRTITIKRGIGEITVSPNPATDKSILTLNSLINASAIIYITDISGKYVHMESRSVTKGNNNIELPVSNLPGGVYLVGIRMEGESAVEKLIVQKK
jgi:hypothetical protein